jgi:hypothetical protein
MGTITKASYERLAAECAEWHKRCRELESALRNVRGNIVIALDLTVDDATRFTELRDALATLNRGGAA